MIVIVACIKEILKGNFTLKEKGIRRAKGKKEKKGKEKIRGKRN
jgi:hypothetical protein